MHLTDFKNYATIKNFKSFILHLFSWKHLLWGVPFFLGGLLYSWLIQKTVKRAVGISTLGIHLNKGMNLILWDEIKEVRPFRFLNIRNLWLIQSVRRKDADALESPGTTFRPEGGGGKLCPGKSSDPPIPASAEN